MDTPIQNKQETVKAKEDKNEEKQEENAEVPKTTQNDFIDDKRLYVMNLSYTVTKEEL